MDVGEVAMLERLRGVEGVAQLVDTPGATVLEDVGGKRLADVPKPLGVDELIELATALARAVAGMHRRGVMHRDITPANIVLCRDGAPCIVGFGLATSLAEIRPEFTHHAEIVGTLAYVAPEQTGRTGRSVDQRADLYALGATLYELATGAPPFGSGDPLRLTHDHLARVPTPPAAANPAVPAALSEIVMHLLEKEPDRRYQSAEGVVYDLERLRAGSAPGAARAGEHDLPLRLPAPSRLIGRDTEVAALQTAFADALSGACRGLLVSGAPGVGKTALVDELRPVVTGAGGWFVAGKFDQYRRDLEFDAFYQALRALGRLLLAEPEQELAAVRDRILQAVGPNAGLLTAAVAEFAALLDVAPDAGDPLTAQARAQRTGLQVLHALASRERPLVVFLDDLQWAGRTPLGTVDLVLSEEARDGLLLVSAYRDGEVGGAHPVATSLARWRHATGVRHLELANLPGPSLATMVSEMLRADPAAVGDLVEVVEPHTRGNPYETVELLDALRRDGVLVATVSGWQWDAAALHAHLGQSEIAGLTADRMEAMSPASRELVNAMACLGGRAELRLLRAATGEPADSLDRRLAPALDDGLLVIEPGTNPAVRFRHDRIREAILGLLDARRRRALQLGMARRLARAPELFAAAAEQYLSVAGEVTEPEERRAAAGLLRRAADQAALIGDYALVEALLAAAVALIDPADHATVVAVRTARHAALFGMGRLDDADDEYLAIDALRSSAVDRADATAVQVRSLSHRARFVEAIELGLASLRECAITVPPAERLPAEVDRQFDRLYAWLDGSDASSDLTRAQLADPTLLATSRLIDAVVPVAYYVPDPAMVAWLGLEALRIWIEHGPGPTLIGSIAHGAYHAVPLRADYAAAYRALQRVVAVGEARGYEPGTSQARHMLAAVNVWFEPLENGVQAAQRAREGLLGVADLAFAGYTYQLAVPYLADCAPSLESFAAEVDAGLAFLRRTGDEQTAQWLDGYQRLARVLRGERVASEAGAVESDADNPLPLLYAHLTRALVAAVLGDPEELAKHSAAAMALVAAAAGSYANAPVRLLRGLALAERARGTDREKRAAALAELDELTRWLAARAPEAPDNLLQMVRLLEAERAWAADDFRAAVLAFDAAQREVAGVQRPWQRALIAEHAARFYLAHGVEHSGHELLAQARRDYLAWGATAKVDQLDWAYPTLRLEAGEPGAVTTGTIDLLGILSASQALSSETSIERLHARVVEVLGAMTGATDVHLLLWSADRQQWLAPCGTDDAVPMSVLRYSQRTGEPLLVGNAAVDERFARDPYFADVDCCSLLAVPVFSRGALRAALVLENRLISGAFSAERLEAVTLIAGQLAVSLDNAQLYAELATSRARIVAAADHARRRLERDLHDGAQQRLVHTIIALKLARRALGDASEQVAELVGDALENAERAIGEIRELARGIHPRTLSSGGLEPALRTITGRCPIPVTLEMRTAGRLPERVETTAYYVVSEALTNAAKHANAEVVEVTVEARDDTLALAISDDGVGGADPARGSGLVGLRDRVEALGGALTVDSRAGQGTRLFVELPVAVEGPASTN